MFILVLKALVIGFAIAAPVGPIGVLCVRKTLELGFKAGLAVGFGAALADAVYGLVAALGLDVLTTVLLEHTRYIQLIGGMFLIYLGIKELKHNPKNSVINLRKSHLLTLISSTFFLTLSNPMTTLSFLGVFSSLIGNSFNNLEAVIMVLGIFLGSGIWWLILSTLVSWTHKRLSEKFIKYLKLFSATIILIFGCLALYNAIGSLNLH